MSKAIRWGILGTGAAAALFAEGLAVAGGELVAVASRSRARAVDFAARFGVAHALEGYASLAARPDLDVVYVATPNPDHAAASLLCIESGRAVVCEKPFTLTAGEAKKVVDAARQKGLFLMEAMWMRFLPAMRELVGRLRDGAVGDMRMATIEMGHPFVFDPGHRVFDAAAGGGALLDLGVYPVSMAIELFGAPARVDSQAVVGATGVDEQVTALLLHEGGRQSLIGASLRTRMANGATIDGTEGWARLEEPLYRSEAFTVARVARMSAVSGAPARSRLARSPWARGLYRRLRGSLPFGRGARTFVRRHAGNGYNHEAAEVMRCLRAGELESPIMPLDQTLHVMETLDAIRACWGRV